MPQRKTKNFLMKFKTLLFLAVVFISLGQWLLPHYYTVHYRLGDQTADFPVLVYFNHFQPSNPMIATINQLAQDDNQHLWKKAVDYEDDMMQQHVYFTPVEKNGTTHYELKAVSSLYTVVATYHIIDDKPQPVSLRSSGLVVWTHAFVITLVLAVLILVVQMVLGLTRAATLSPDKKKRLQRHARNKSR